MRDLFSLEGKTAVVTGGSTGIGAMIAEGFVNFGAKVYIVARREELLQQKQVELGRIGLCEYLVADVGSVAGIKELTSYARRLRAAVDLFDVLRAESLLSQYPQHLQSLGLRENQEAAG